MCKCKRFGFAAAFVAAFVLSACGGGGGGDGGSNPNPGGGTNPTSVTCPNGTSAASAAVCPAVTMPTSVPTTAMSPILAQQNGISVSFNGALDPTSVVVTLWQGAVGTGTQVAGTFVLSNGNKDVTFKPNVRLVFGQTFNLVVTAKDTLGRAVSGTFTFATSAMVCADNTRFSNPAAFSSAYQDCVVPLGVQAIIDPVYNKMTDASCVVSIGAPLSAACRTYMANGTMVVATPPSIVGGHSTLWSVFIGPDMTSNIVVSDATNPAALTVLSKLVLSDLIMWIIPNPTGEDSQFNVGGVMQNYQISADANTGTLSRRCQVTGQTACTKP